MAPLLCYRAGPKARRILLDQGLNEDNISTFVGPASGPKWLVLAGLDRAFIKLGLLAGKSEENTLFVGSSAGGWRILALASRDPLLSLQGLIAGYVHQVFTREDDAITVSAAYREMLAELFSEQEIEYILNRPDVSVALHVARCRGSRSKSRAIQVPRLVAASLASCVSGRGARLFFERMLFHSRPETMEGIASRVLPLTAKNFLSAAMATGTVPIYMDPVDSPDEAPAGLYIDGGLTDYHLNQRFGQEPGPPRIVLFPHYRRRIAPSWFDKHLPYRKPHRSVLDNVLQIYPSDELLARLPDGRLPDRQDFSVFVDRPEERIRRWHRAVALSEEMGQELQADLESGRFLDRLESF